MISPTVDWFLYLTLISLLLSASPASSGPVVTTHVYSRGSGKGPTLTDALKNDNITRIIVGSASLDLAHELDGLPAKYRLDRCAWSQQSLRGGRSEMSISITSQRSAEPNSAPKAVKLSVQQLD
jgi:hypothetical protein